MRSKIAIIGILAGLVSLAHADPQFYGSWQNIENDDRIDILDGFKPGLGPVLIIEEDGSVSSRSWESKGADFSIKIGYQDHKASLGADGNLVLEKSFGDPLVFKRLEPRADAAAINLKEDETAFASKLQDYIWLTSLDGTKATFKSTFAPDAGVVELFKGDVLEDLRAWALASGVIKIGRDVIVEARITDKYFVGLNERDDFVVFKAIEPASARAQTDVDEQREAFFNGLLTGEWATSDWGTVSIHKFRPIYGDLAGEVFTVREGRLTEDSEWEYSPATGALKIGYTEYVGAMIVNDTLALIEKDGDQKFYSRATDSSEKRYTLGDVKTTPLNENSLAEISNMLSPQLQRGDYLYSFEFKEDGRTGFAHKWQSTPFTITGETFDTKMIGESERLFQVEDFIVFEGEESFKMDASESRLRPKSDAEAAADVKAQEDLKSSAQSRAIVIRVLTVDGKTRDVPLPLSDFSEIANISILKK